MLLKRTKCDRSSWLKYLDKIKKEEKKIREREIKKCHKTNREKLTDGYIRWYLSQKFSIQPDLICDEAIELKRLQLKLYRTIRQGRNKLKPSKRKG